MLVWFLISSLNPLIYLLFWRGAITTLSDGSGQWSLSAFASYYLLLIIANSFLQVHIEENIARFDIQEGYLANHLLKPVPYFWQKFFHELPFRCLEGLFGVVVFIFFWFAYPGVIKLSDSAAIFSLSILVMLCGYFISFLFKMILGLSALWTTDFTGLAQLAGVVILVFGGFVVPLDLFPSWLRTVAFALPFSYMFYFPVRAFQGSLPMGELWRAIGMQLVWIVAFLLLYRRMWTAGLKRFTGVGQ